MILFLVFMFIFSLELGGSLKAGIVIFVCWCLWWLGLSMLDRPHHCRICGKHAGIQQSGYCDKHFDMLFRV